MKSTFTHPTLCVPGMWAFECVCISSAWTNAWIAWCANFFDLLPLFVHMQEAAEDVSRSLVLAAADPSAARMRAELDKELQDIQVRP